MSIIKSPLVPVEKSQPQSTKLSSRPTTIRQSTTCFKSLNFGVNKVADTNQGGVGLLV